MHYLDEGWRICIGRLVNARMITALGQGQRLNPKSLWACSNNDTWQVLGKIARLDLIGSISQKSAVTYELALTNQTAFFSYSASKHPRPALHT